MRTQVMDPCARGAPWLELCAPGQPPQRIELDAFPFVIGRGETAQLRLDSARVSREHAAVVQDRQGYRLRDLGSTNGTFRNGHPVKDELIEDGDLLSIADEELSFHSGRPAPINLATQVMDRATAADGRASAEVVRSIRRWQEVLLRGGVGVMQQSVARLADGRVLGYELSGEGLDDDPAPGPETVLLATDCRIAERARQLQRMVAVDAASQLTGAAQLFLRLHPLETGSPTLVDSLCALSRHLGNGQRLVVLLGACAATGAPYYREIRSALGEAGVGVACDGLTAPPTGDLATAELRPDFWRLDPALVRQLERGRGGSRQVELVLSALKRLGGDVIAAGVDSEAEAGRLLEWGCAYAQGELFGAPQPLFRRLAQ